MPFGGRVSHSPGGYNNFSFEESGLMIPELERDENLIAATRHIVRRTRDANKIMAGLDTQLHSMTKANEDDDDDNDDDDDSDDDEEEEGFSAVQDRLNAIEEVIMRWEEDQSMVWDSEPEEASDYLNAANEARRLIEELEALHLSKEDQEYKFLHSAYNILQTAMARLEEEFTNLLIQDRRASEYVSSSSRSNDEESTADGSPAASLGDNSVESLQREEEHILHLTNPNVVPDLRCIANLMFACNYGQECSRAYTIVRRDALDESLFILEMDRLSIENVLRMEWSTLNSKIKRWIWAVKIFVKVYLASEKWLSDQIFGEGEPTSLVCFVDASKVSILKLLDFGQFVSIARRNPEKLLGFLDMYEVLASLMPDIDALYSDDIGSCVRIECHKVLKLLGDSVKATFHEFEHAIASDVSQNPFVGGGGKVEYRVVVHSDSHRGVSSGESKGTVSGGCETTSSFGSGSVVLGGGVGVGPEVSHLGWGRGYTLRELEAATGGLCEANVIGEGGYGIVYRGVLTDGTKVAVKNLLNNKGQVEREFKVEVEAIGGVRHKNLVRLLGYCVEGAYRMLVYEYVDNGNLEQWLHGDVGPVSPLTWDIRMNIILGTARGLAYLHEGLEPKVVHRDVKSSNILIDRQWNSKVSDFGLAKLLSSENSYVTTRVMGPFGYVAPEYACTGMLNEKSDVYSFGILIMEIITGRSPVDCGRPQGEVNLIHWLKTMVVNRKSEEVVDPKLPEKPSSKTLKRALFIALRCIDPDATKRPKMGHVIRMLETINLLFHNDQKTGG